MIYQKKKISWNILVSDQRQTSVVEVARNRAPSKGEAVAKHRGPMVVVVVGIFCRHQRNLWLAGARSIGHNSCPASPNILPIYSVHHNQEIEILQSTYLRLAAKRIAATKHSVSDERRRWRRVRISWTTKQSVSEAHTIWAHWSPTSKTNVQLTF